MSPGPQQIPGGFILLARSLLESPIWAKPPLYSRLWVWLLLKANHSDRERKGRQYRRGELLTTYSEIQNGLGYTHRRKRVFPTMKEVRGALDWMQSEGMITTAGVRRIGADLGADLGADNGAYVGVKIIIVNFDSYQSMESYAGRPWGRPWGRQSVGDSSELGHYNKELKENRREEPTPDGVFRLEGEESKPVAQPGLPKGFDRLPPALREPITVACEALAPAWPRVFEWVNHALKDGRRPEAIRQALDFMANDPGAIRSPWPFAERTCSRISQDLNAAEAQAEHERLKQSDPVAGLLKYGFKAASHGA